MPSIFSAMKTRKTKRHHGNRTLKRTLPAATTPLSTSNHASSGTSSDSGSKHSRANDGQGSTALVSPSPPLIDSSSDMKSKDSGNTALVILPPTPKTLSQPELSRVVSQNPPTKLARKSSKISCSGMKFGVTSALGGPGHGRKSQHQGTGDDKGLLNDLRKQASTVDGRGADKDVGNDVSNHPPIHGIMKTATNVSVGAGTHSVRFTLDLPPQLDLDLSLSNERGEGGNLDKKGGDGLARKPSRWGKKTTEAVLDRSKVVSTGFIPREDDGGRNCDERKGELMEVDGVSPNDPTNKTVSLHEQQSVQRNSSHTSLISTLECEPSFTIHRLEDLAAGLELPPNGKKTVPVVPNLGRVSSVQERVVSRSGMLRSDSAVEEIVRNSASSMNSSRMALMRNESSKGYQPNGCVSA